MKVMAGTCKASNMQIGTCKCLDCGLITSLLSFNVAKRIYKNDLEHLTILAPFSLLNGLFMPYTTIGLLATYFLGRQLYSAGYFEKEGAMN